MSAIYGLMNIGEKPVLKSDLIRMGNALATLGPDDSGVWFGNTVALGQHLMRLTPEDCFESQPVICCDKKIILVADARIDNRSELARKLDISSPESKSLPDSKYIALSYEKWGFDCPRHLIGAYAFALWDERTQQLFLARSPMGERSLYYRHSAENFAFATMPRGLFTLPWIPREINLEYLADYLVMVPHEPGASFYEGIRRLPAGHILVLNRAGVFEQRYWPPDFEDELRLPRDEEYVEAFTELFERVVEDHRRSLFPVGVMLSGGLDSTSIAAVVAGQLRRENKRLTTFTEVPRPDFDGAIIPGRYADETPYVKAMARCYENMDQIFISSVKGFYLDDASDFFTGAEIPFRNASNRVWYEALLNEAMQRGVRLLLTGATGNLTISWDGKGLLPQLLRKGQFARALREARGISRFQASGSTMRALVSRGIMPLLPRGFWVALQRLRRPTGIMSKLEPWAHYSPIRSEFAADQRILERALSRGEDFLFRSQSSVRAMRWATLLQNDSRSDYDTCYRAKLGVEQRDPTGDSRIVTFCLSLPEEQFMRGGISRWLLRRSMSHRLPNEVLCNPRRGLQAADWFERLHGAEQKINQEIEQLRTSTLASSVLDLNRLHGLVADMKRVGNEPSTVLQNYRGVLERGLMTGRFLRWFESGV